MDRGLLFYGWPGQTRTRWHSETRVCLFDQTNWNGYFSFFVVVPLEHVKYVHLDLDRLHLPIKFGEIGCMLSIDGSIKGLLVSI